MLWGICRKLDWIPNIPANEMRWGGLNAAQCSLGCLFLSSSSFSHATHPHSLDRLSIIEFAALIGWRRKPRKEDQQSKDYAKGPLSREPHCFANERIFPERRCTGRSTWILHWKLLYYICCLTDVVLRIERDLSNNIKNTSISGVKFGWTTLYIITIIRYAKSTEDWNGHIL